MPPADGSTVLASQPARGVAGGSRAAGFVERNRFLLTFAVLSSLMGTTVGMAQVSASLYAVQLGSSKTMLGLIAGSQSVGVLAMSLPIGVMVDRFGPARPFVLGTLLAGATYALLPIWATPSWLLACTAAISFFMPFRFVALNTVFLQQLASLGEAKAGWYRGTHMLGMFLLGPALGARAISSLGFAWFAQSSLLAIRSRQSRNARPAGRRCALNSRGWRTIVSSARCRSSRRRRKRSARSSLFSSWSWR
jgi:MFS family permease